MPRLTQLLTSEQIKEKLLAHRSVTAGGCWEWTKGRSRNGYGVVSIGARQQRYAHRLAYALFVGPIPEEREVCHRCDNPPCFNAVHLFVGTHHDNMLDAAAKGIMRFPRATGLHANRCVLSIDQVHDIRSSRESLLAISKRLGVSWTAVKDCHSRRTYRDVP